MGVMRGGIRFLCITSSNRVTRILFLISTFRRARGFLYTIQIEWFRFLYVRLYVGRIAVLFLFVLISQERHRRDPLSWRKRIRRGGRFLMLVSITIELPRTTPSFLLWGILCHSPLPTILVRRVLFDVWKEPLLLTRRTLVVGIVGSIKRIL